MPGLRELTALYGKRSMLLTVLRSNARRSSAIGQYTATIMYDLGIDNALVIFHAVNVHDQASIVHQAQGNLGLDILENVL